MNNVISKDEEMYGFVGDIVEEIKHNLKLAIDNNEADSVLMEALEEALALNRENDNRFYKVWYNPMGAYIFEEMIIKGEK